MLASLGINHIPASSPQTKGRIERLFNTLQHRLRIELRLAGITTLEEANAFLPGFFKRFNARFAVAPWDPEPAFRPAPPPELLAQILSGFVPKEKDGRGTRARVPGRISRFQSRLPYFFMKRVFMYWAKRI
ncbi:MAG: hypothetical protein ACPLQO_05935 [Desulfotomaculales bacterium]